MMAEHKCIIWFSPRIVWMLALFLGANKEIIPISAAPPDLASELTVPVTEITTTGAIVKWTLTTGTFDGFGISISPPSAGITSSPLAKSATGTVVAGLSAGVQYTVSVWTVDGTGNGTPKTATFNAQPNPLSGSSAIAFTNVGTTSATITWVAAIGIIDKYIVTLTPVPGVTQANPVEVNALSTTFQGLTAGTSYTVEVKTKAGTTEGHPVTNTFISKPVAVDVSTIQFPSITINSASVSWTVVASADAYDVTIAQTGPTTPVITHSPSSANTATIASLSPGVEYTLSITSKKSGVAGATTTKKFRTKPQPVTQSTISFTEITTYTAKVAWGKVTTGVFDTYSISINPTATIALSSVVSSVNSPNTDLSVLTAGTEYTITIKTVSGGVESDAVTKTFKTKPDPVDAGTIQFPTITTNSASVLWTAVASADAYDVAITPQSPTNPSITHNPTLATSASIASLSPGVEYTLSITSKKTGVAGATTTKKFRTKPPNLGGSVVVEAVETTTATAKWTKPAAGTFTNYKITVTPDVSGVAAPTVSPTTVLSNEASPSVALSGLVAGQVYTVSMQTNWDGVEGQATTQKFRTKPLQVTNIVVTTPTTTTAAVTWKPLTLDAKYNSIYKYQVDIVQPGPVVSPNEVQHPGTTTGVTGLTPGTSYSAMVKTIAGTGMLVRESDPAVQVFIAKPTPVTQSSITFNNIGTTAAEATWNKVSVGGFTSYKVSISPTGPTLTPSPVLGSTDPPKTSFTNLLPGTKYTFTVTTVSGTVESVAVSATFTAKPLPVTGVTLTPNGNKMIISWTAGVNSTQSSYKVRHHAVFQNSTSSWTEASINPPTLTTEISITPGEKYEVEVIAISGDQSSDTAAKSLVTAPFPPASAFVTNAAATTTSIEVTWTAPSTNSYFIKYVIKYTKQGQGSKEVTATNTELKKTITGLEAGVKYTVNVFTESKDNKRSDTSANTVGTAKPNCDVKMTDLSTETTKLKANYSESSLLVFTHYRFVISDGLLPTSRDVLKANTPRILEYTQGVQPGVNYTVKASCVSNSVQSNVTKYFLVSVPAPVTTVDLVSVSFNYVKMTLHRPAGTFNSVEVKCSGPSKGQQNGCTFPKSIFNFIGSTYNVTYVKLRTHENYTFTITVTSNGKQSSPKVVKAKTSHGRPGPVSTFRVTSETPTRAKLVWTTPVDPNGLVSTYVVRYAGTYDALNLPIHKGLVTYNVDPLTHSYTQFLDRLKGGYHYDFIIYGQTDYPGPGENVGQPVTMKTAAPTLLAGATTPAKTSTEPTETTIKMKFKVSFNESNGPILYYSIIGRENLEGGALKTQMMDESSIQRWKQVKDRTDEWPAYFAIHQCKIFSEPTTCEGKPTVSRKKRSATPDSVEVTIGIQDCKNVAVYCNGALKAGAYYQFSLRGYTGPDKYEDTVFSERILTSTSGLGVIVGGVSAVLIAFIIGVVVITVVVIKKRKANKEGAESSQGPEASVPVTNPAFSDIYDELTFPVPPVPKQVEPPVMAMVTRYLPDASNVKREELQRIFTMLGVQKIQDMTFLKAKDITPPLMVIEARRFLDQILEQEERGGYDEGVYVEAAADPQQVQHDIYYSNVPVPAGGTVPHRGNEALYVNIGGGTNNAAESNNQENAYASLDQADMKADAGVYEKLGKGRKK